MLCNFVHFLVIGLKIIFHVPLMLNKKNFKCTTLNHLKHFFSKIRIWTTIKKLGQKTKKVRFERVIKKILKFTRRPFWGHRKIYFFYHPIWRGMAQPKILYIAVFWMKLPCHLHLKLPHKSLITVRLTSLKGTNL